MKTSYKKITGLFILLWGFSIFLQAQSTSQNYVLSRAYTSTTTYLDQIQYFDGLGRPVETVQRQFSPNRKDIVSRIDYDYLGRKSKIWLPFPSSKSDGTYNGSSTAIAQYGDNYPYSEIFYEASSLNRIDRQYGPGVVWRNNDRKVKTEYLTNSSGGDQSCPYYQLVGETVKRNGTYAAGTISVIKVTGENNQVSYEFKNKLGQVLCQRNICEGQQFDTNFIYDDSGNLKYVLPPLASDNTTQTGASFDENHQTIKNYAYLYRYDSRNRCIWKKLPGADPVNMVYDRSDRLIFSQDGEQKKQNKYTFYKYDLHGRLIISGERTDARTAETMRAAFKDALIVETYLTSGGSWFNYTNNDPMRITYNEVHLVNFYDDYHFINQFGAASYLKSVKMDQYGWARIHDSAKGMQTGSLVKLLDGSNKEIVSAIYYDAKGQVAQIRTNNHMGGMDYTYYCYNFDGTVYSRQTEHGIVMGRTDVTEKYTYEHDDHTRRLKSTTYKLNNETEKKIAAYGYNEIGQINRKTTGELETSSYSYNLRGWLTVITGNRFSQNFYYTDNVHPYGDTYFNGNISCYTFKTSERPNVTRGYTFHYDELDRLRNAGYGEGSNIHTSAVNAYNENFNLDKHGNVLQIVRSGRLGDNSYGTIDIATAQKLEGNKIIHTYDYGGDQPYSDLMEVKTRWERYNTYDSNGRQTKDGNKQISKIEYYYLNLPKRIEDDFGSSIDYIYDASGVKRTVKRNPVGTTSVKTDYVDNKIYENGVLKMILHDEGYIERTGSTSAYYYYLKDHLGNNRMVINTSGTTVQATNYYPFGMSFAEVPARNDQYKQSFKFNGKELDRMMNLDLYDYMARQYDPVMGRFMTMDPLAEKYYSVSPYAYCKNNPINRIDPDGMDDYLLRDDGRMLLAKKTDDKYDQLYATQRDEGDHLTVVGDPLRVNDKGLLSQMTGRSEKGGDNAITSNSEDAFNLFKFAADNSNVEWSLSGYKDQSSIKFYLNTQHSDGYARTGNGGAFFETKDMLFNVHSHSKEDGIKGGSGYYYNLDGNVAQYAPGEDGSNAAAYYHLLGNKMPSLYVYHRYTNALYKYTPWKHNIQEKNWKAISSGTKMNNIINH